MHALLVVCIAWQMAARTHSSGKASMHEPDIPAVSRMHLGVKQTIKLVQR